MLIVKFEYRKKEDRPQSDRNLVGGDRFFFDGYRTVTIERDSPGLYGGGSETFEDLPFGTTVYVMSALSGKTLEHILIMNKNRSTAEEGD